MTGIARPYLWVFGRPFVKLFAVCYRFVICLSVCPVYPILSVCDVGVLWPNAWMDHGETWHEGRPWPRPHCVRCWPSSVPPILPPQKKRKGTQPPIFGPCLLWPNGWIDQDATWYESRRRLLCVRWGPSSPLKGAQPPIFRPMSIVVKRSCISAIAEHLSTESTSIHSYWLCSGVFVQLHELLAERVCALECGPDKPCYVDTCCGLRKDIAKIEP